MINIKYNIKTTLIIGAIYPEKDINFAIKYTIDKLVKDWFLEVKN